MASPAEVAQDRWAAEARALVAEGDARRRAEYAALRALLEPGETR